MMTLSIFLVKLFEETDMMYFTVCKAWDDDVSQFLLKARIDVIDTEKCKQLLIGIGRLDYTQICVYDTIQQQGTVCSVCWKTNIYKNVHVSISKEMRKLFHLH